MVNIVKYGDQNCKLKNKGCKWWLYEIKETKITI